MTAVSVFLDEKKRVKDSLTRGDRIGAYKSKVNLLTIDFFF